MSTFYLTSQEAIDNKLLSLRKLRTSDDGWSTYFLDEANNEEWQLTRHHGAYQGGGLPILKRLPPPSISELIEISLTSDDINNITGAAIELNEREKYNNEQFREDLINKLLLVDTSTLSAFEKNRMKTIIYESKLFDPINRNEIVGKHWTEIKKEADFYKGISDKANSILRKVE